MTQYAYPEPGERPSADLSPRQVECLELAATGLTSAEIGRRLGVSSRTVDEHLLTACRVLGVRTRVQAVARLAMEERRPPEPRSFLP
ncbi:helix-turn-helix domain-containing protein [Brevundimonas variabilis]|uniref:DNA-binding CsgD family transcriptional regulator n=1 Tax=Brevundimonas variabilis TaxID=74312 RepID=A0A7W9CJ49_9CAUL|nr:helix-turn-helix transcriptional regulator [Brevundimonas variabilis]MBB5746542.1 DNA-binding CsgD family transcriptional regulator [Brevundimonas variabilis]